MKIFIVVINDRFFDYENPNYSTAQTREKIYKLYEYIRRVDLESNVPFKINFCFKKLCCECFFLFEKLIFCTNKEIFLYRK